MANVKSKKKKFIPFFNDVSYVTFTQKDGKNPIYFTIIANKAHKTMNVIFKEDETRDPENDTLHFIHDLVIAYPNQFYEVPLSEVSDFVKMIEGIKTKQDYEAFENTYGISKSSGKFWPHSDRLQQHILKKYPVTGGVLDLNRYGTHLMTKR